MATTSTLRTRSPEDERRLEEFERRASLPILVSALLPILFSLTGRNGLLQNLVLVVAWVVFVVDLVVHVRLIPRYLRTGKGVFDLVVVVLTAPWFLIPGLGDARFLALARLARLTRILKASGGGLVRLMGQLGKVGLVTGILIFSCAYVALSVERSTNDAFSSYGEAVWWATVTMTTVGYGDIYPITTQGRLTGAVLMFSGLAVLGVLAGTLASFFGFGGDDAETPAEGDAALGAPAAAAPATAGDGAADLERRLLELERAIAEVRRQLSG